MTQEQAKTKSGLGRVRGKAAIVTGAGSGIGRATAQMLAREGASVAAADIDRDAAQATADAIASEGGRAIALHCDVAEETSVREMIAQASEAFGRLDILHNNAAALGATSPGEDSDITEIDVAVWDRAMAVNLRGVMLGCKHAIPLMLANGGGSIINTSSGAATGGDFSGPAYAASKAGVNTFTLYVATQYGKRGIRCNAVLPGLILTEAANAGLPEEVRAMILDHHLTPRVGKPDDIASMVLFLASDEAEYITGQLIDVNGGILSHLPTYADLRRMRGEA